MSFHCWQVSSSFLLVLIATLLECGHAEQIYRVDPLALLSGTLRTYQRAACDGDIVALRCPPGTSISVQLAQYGRGGSTPSLCPAQGPTTTPVPYAGADQATTCLWPNALQTVVEACQKKRTCKFNTSPKTFGGDPCPGLRKYVEVAYKCRPYEFRSKVGCQNDVIQLRCNPHARIAIYSASFGRTEYESIQCPQPQGVPEETCLMSYATETVMQMCHGKRRCTLTADKATFGEPCKENSRMYLKVVYTCVPRRVLKERYEEQPEEDEEVLAVGSKGMPEYEDDDDIGDEFNGEHGNVSPAPAAAGPEVAGTRQQGNMTYTGGAKPQSPSPDGGKPTIVPNPGRSRGKTTGAAPPPSGSNSFSITTTSKPPSRPAKPFLHALTSPQPTLPSSSPTLPQLASTNSKDNMQGDNVEQFEDLANVNCTITIFTTSDKNRVIGFISEWINAYNFIANNQEKFYLYLILSVSAGLLLFLGVVIGRLLVQRQRARARAKFHVSEPLPNGFADEISEIDADIDLTTTVPPPPPMAPPPIQPGSARNSMGRPDEVVRYSNRNSGGVGGTNSIRRQDSDTNPRSLQRPGNSQYYYG